jgi:hypothetical protein
MCASIVFLFAPVANWLCFRSLYVFHSAHEISLLPKFVVKKNRSYQLHCACSCFGRASRRGFWHAQRALALVKKCQEMNFNLDKMRKFKK